tara:strand:+ start:360 stop:509 length:150 start_codon:yes stop_codon:yes gene_type:complete
MEKEIKNAPQHRVKNIAYFSSIVWSLLCLLASDFPSENPRSQTRNVPYT